MSSLDPIVRVSLDEALSMFDEAEKSPDEADYYLSQAGSALADVLGDEGADAATLSRCHKAIVMLIQRNPVEAKDLVLIARG